MCSRFHRMFRVRRMSDKIEPKSEGPDFHHSTGGHARVPLAYSMYTTMSSSYLLSILGVYPIRYVRSGSGGRRCKVVEKFIVARMHRRRAGSLLVSKSDGRYPIFERAPGSSNFRTGGDRACLVLAIGFCFVKLFYHRLI